MKKKIFSIVLSLCMVVAMMPMASGFAWAEETSSEGSGSTTESTIVGTAVENVTFTHTYDVQRNPAYPVKGNKVKLSGLRDPYIAEDRSVDSEGTWKLHKVGTFLYAKTLISDAAKLKNLNEIVDTVVSKYGELGVTLNKDSMAIHELTKNGDHIAYGVVVAYDGPQGHACFIGDTLSNGAGYLLSTKEETSSVTMTAGEVASDMAKNLSISLDQTGEYVFTSKNEGYTPEAKTVTITNVGNANTGKLTIALSGAGADNFESLPTEITGIGTDEGARTASFDIKPKAGLTAGTYKATVTVSGTDLDPQSFNVSFKVNDNSTSVEPPAAHTHTYGTPTYQWSDDGKTCTASKTCTDASCSVSEGRTITENGTITSAVKTPATYTSKGTTTYTATFTDGSGFTTQTKDVDDIPQLVYVPVHSHDYSQHIASDRYKKSDATCLSPAVYYVSCICGAKGTATFESGEKGAHNYVDGKCTVCGEISKALAKSELSSDFEAVPTADAMKVFWGKVEGADGYDVYVQICGKKFTAGSITNVADGNATETVIKKVNGKKIDLNRNYKIFVKAHKLVDGKKVILSRTVIAHSTSVKNAKYTNVKDITVSKNSYDLSVGTTANIVAHSVKADGKKQILGDNHVKEFRYASSNKAVATVSKSGKITALTAGNCEIYVYGINGSREVVEVTVK